MLLGTVGFLQYLFLCACCVDLESVVLFVYRNTSICYDVEHWSSHAYSINCFSVIYVHYLHSPYIDYTKKINERDLFKRKLICIHTIWRISDIYHPAILSAVCFLMRLVCTKHCFPNGGLPIVSTSALACWESMELGKPPRSRCWQEISQPPVERPS